MPGRKRRASVSQKDENENNARKKLRIDLLALKQSNESDRNELVDASTGKFEKALRNLDNLSKKVNKPSEATLVCEQTSLLSGILQEQARACDANAASVTVHEFITKLKTREFMDGTELDLDAVYDVCGQFYEGIPPLFSFTHVPGIIHEQKEKKKRARPKRKVALDITEECTQATELPSPDEKNSTDTTVRVHKLQDFLVELQRQNPGKTFNLFETLNNPQSFSESLENFFDLAHLVHRGTIKIANEDGMPVMTILGKKGHKEARHNSTDRAQFCLTFDADTHTALSQHMTQSQIPGRGM